MTCPVCRYHSGDLSDSHRACPMIHTYKAPPPRAWAQHDDDYAAAMDELGAHQYEMEQTDGPR